jgi:hypothetical protein
MRPATRLEELLGEMPGRLSAISEEEAARKPDPAKWSKKEILGHLIDSAANNHQRFVRAQLAPAVELPGYEQDGWVRVQAYMIEPWQDLIEFWRFYNRHLVHVMETIPEDYLAHTCAIGGKPAVTLGFLVEDYVRHLEHHLDQIFH